MADAGFTKVSEQPTRIVHETSENDADFPAETLDFTGKNGHHFVIDFSRELGRGGEAVVVVAYDDMGQEYAAKVYTVSQSRREQRNHDAVLKFLSAQTHDTAERYQVTHLMPLFDYGTLVATLIGEAHSREFSVTIVPKCNCLGDKRLSKQDVKTRVIPSLAEALNELHKHQIVHRDVKPSNVYEYRGTIVLGDYGISTMLDRGEDLKDTHANRGTAGYWLPFGYVEPRGDWYSFGYTIWTMYNNNVHPHQARIDAGNLLGDVYAGKRIVPFIPASEEDASLRDLIYGLTTVYAERRLGYDDVQRWLKDPENFTFEDVSYEATVGWRHKYTFDGTKTDNGSQLAAALSGNWDYAIQHLFDGSDLVEHFSRNDENDLSTKLRIIVRDYAGVKQDLGLAEAIYLISGADARMTWRGRDVSFPTLLTEFVSQPVENLAWCDSLFQSGFLSWVLREGSLEAPGIDVATVELIEKVSIRFPHFARALFQQLFAGGGTSVYAGLSDPADLVQTFIENPQRFYGVVGERNKLEEAVAALAPFYADAGKLEQLVASLDSFEENLPSDMNKFLLLLEELDKTTAVSAFAMNYGPAAPWIWVEQNRALYEVRGRGIEGARGTDGVAVFDEPDELDGARSTRSTAGTIDTSRARRAITALEKLSAQHRAQTAIPSVTDIVKWGEAARYHAEIIEQEMDPSPVPSYLGLQTATGVVARCDDAYFCGQFYGQAVPRGFVRKLATTPGVEVDSWPEVSLLSEKTKDELRYVDEGCSLCDSDLAKCNDAQTALGRTGLSWFRFILDVALVLATILLAPTWSVVLAPLSASFLALFDGTLEAGRLFTQVALSALCFFFAFDGVISFWLARGSSTIAAAKKIIAHAKEELKSKATDFHQGKGEFVRELEDVSRNDAHTSMMMTKRLASAMASVRSIASPGRSGLFRAIWTVVSIIGIVYCTSVVLVFLMPVLGFPPWISTVLLFVGNGIVYFFARTMFDEPESRLYTSYGLIGLLGVEVLADVVVTLALLLVLAILEEFAPVIVVLIIIVIVIGILGS